MFTKSAAFLTTLALPAFIVADGAFHTAAYYVSNITQYSGTIVVPPNVASGGTPYLWPGLQPPDNSGVLQPVLDGRGQHWYFGNAYVGNPSEPYGGGVSCGVNDHLGFSMIEDPEGSGNWDISSSNPAGDQAKYTYNIGKRMNQAVFAVELYDTNWDFGNLVFQDVTIVAETSDTSFCTANPQYSDVTIDFEGVASTVTNGVTTCTIDQVTLSPP